MHTVPTSACWIFLRSLSTEVLNHWLLRFIVEARQEDRDPYLPGTLSCLLAGLYLFANSCDHTAQSSWTKIIPHLQN